MNQTCTARIRAEIRTGLEGHGGPQLVIPMTCLARLSSNPIVRTSASPRTPVGLARHAAAWTRRQVWGHGWAPGTGHS
jgi:hypothetical protein